MKKLIVKLIGISLLAFFILGCDDDTIENPYPTQPDRTIQFVNDSLKINEADGEKEIILSVSAKAIQDGYVTLVFDTTFNKLFTTTPAAANGRLRLSVRKGDTSVGLKVRPTDNTLVTGTSNIILLLKEVTIGYQIGENKTLVLAIKDNDSHSPDKNSHVNFIPQNRTVKENNTNWHEIQLHVSEAATASGSVIVKIESDNAGYGTHYITEPAISGNTLLLTINPGTSVSSFKVRTVNNDHISGNLDLTFEIKETTGNLKKGTTLSESFKISDDELEGLPKGYEVSGGSWSRKQTYEYTPNGQISKVIWETRTPYFRSGVRTYYYQDSNQVTRINTGAGEDLLYSYANGRIVMEQQVVNGIIERYTEFGYDEAGNVGAYQTHHLQPDGTFSHSFTGVLLYFPNGNLYKKLVYTPPASESEEPVLISTETFDNYLNKPNPFPVVEVLPNTNTQKLLPALYRYEGNGKDLQYSFSYDFRDDGKVGKRTTTGPGTFEVAVYHYY